ncbi:ECF transporter S component [Alloscardovia omnicolens]|uniref:ECF transporter S component n=1 Tax=Alloscardovia omnicolens TaxID=419015 RepID=UPI003A71D29A
MPSRKSDHENSHKTSQPYWTSQRIAIYALFSALALALSFLQIPIFPAAPFLKYDPSGIVVLLAGFAYGPYAATIISVLSALPHLITDPLGGLILLACSLAFSVPSAWIYKNHRTRKFALISMFVGAVCFITTALVLNLAITPFYTATDFHTVLGMLLPLLLPFNVLKALIHLAITTVCYKPITGLLKAFTASQESQRRV